MLNITYRDKKTNIWVREKTKVTDMIEQPRSKMEEDMGRARQQGTR